MAQLRIEIDGADHHAEDLARPFTGAILMCPVCSTADDAECWGINEMHCTNCETVYAVFLLPRTVSEHSMTG